MRTLGRGATVREPAHLTQVRVSACQSQNYSNGQYKTDCQQAV